MRIAVLGLGHMGAPIAERLEQAGHELSVWNRSPAAVHGFVERGVRALAHPADAWEYADAVITMLADGQAVQDVTLGEHGLLGPGATGVLIDMSTISAETSATIAAACERRGVDFLRAPVTGNPSVVVAGGLGIIVSGPRAVFERLAPALNDAGSNVFYVGSAEEARIVKLALNLIVGGTAELIAEAVVLAERNGIARADMLEVMGGSAVGSPFVRYNTAPLVADDYRPRFSARLMDKDLTLVLAAAERVSVPLPLTEQTAQLVQRCVADGMGDWDVTALLPRLRREADGA
jgi:3-hydroxyisobutyrate dehydrogenase-like beta-hydroxyacid dehydrogenase